MAKIKLDLKSIKAIDKSGMLDLLWDFPLQGEAAIDLAAKAKILFQKRDFNKIVFAGLGGSAIGADLVRSYLYFESKIPITVLREYQLPAYVDNSTLVFISSYSGNTEETLSSFAEAKKRGAAIICISSDGKVKEEAQKDNFTFLEIPSGLPPRCSLGYLSLVPLCLLAKFGLAADPEPFIRQMAGVLEELRNKNLKVQVGQKDNLAKAIAWKLFNKFAVIYSSSIHFDVCATRLLSLIHI